MYYRNREQETRKKNYARFERLTRHGFSISTETAVSALYVVNDDPFGRSYYQKAIGETVVKDPVTGQNYVQEEWATKEFIVDNKTQLVNKASADLLLGRNLAIRWPEGASTTEEQALWLEELQTRNSMLTLLYESAIRNSSLGDQFYEITIKDGRINIDYVNPYYVDIEHEGRDVRYYELAWEKVGPEGKRRMPSWLMRTRKEERLKKFVYKKIHHPGYILRELWEEKRQEYFPVPLVRLPEYAGLVDRALADPNMRTFVNFEVGAETDSRDSVYSVVEYTGVDVPLIVHWPNYRMFDIFGVSDAGMIEGLQNALNNRGTQLNDVLDKHADPAMYGPDSYTDTNGNLTMSGGGGRYFPMPPDAANPPGYLIWNSHLPECQVEILRIYESICANSEISPALMGMDKGGIESGRALMYKLIRSLAMKTRKQSYMYQAIRDIVEIAQKLQAAWPDESTVVQPEPRTEWPELLEPTIDTRSSLPTDVTEAVQQVVPLVTNGILDRKTALAILDKFFEEIEPEEVEKRLSEEDARNAEAEKAKMNELFRGVPVE